MTLFLENSFFLNNNISISNKIKHIPLYFLYFSPIIEFHSLDENYKKIGNTTNNNIQKNIRYKIIRLRYTNETLFTFTNDNFFRAIYHIFLSCYKLHNNNISFTITEDSFILGENDMLPILCDFSQSFNFQIIKKDTLKMYFNKQIMENKYISIDVFLICYLLTNNIDIMTPSICSDISELFCNNREKIEINKIKENINYFINYDTNTVITYIMQWKNTWSYYSLCYYFLCNYSNFLCNFSLQPIFETYIHSSFKERKTELLQTIHEILFCNNSEL